MTHVTSERIAMPPQSPQEVMAAVAATVNAHDLDAFMALHEPDAIVVPPGGVEVRGYAAMREVLEPLFAGEPSTEIDLHGMLQGDGLAMSHSHFTISLTRPDGERVVKKGMGTVVTRRQPDGSWRIVFDYPIRA
jgi:uncharacterized protein (TIGR02246 family)